MNHLKKDQHSDTCSQENECFVIKHTLKNAPLLINEIKPSKKSNDKDEDIEDFLLNKILQDKIVYGKMISNSWLKNPFCQKKNVFGNDTENLFLFDNDYLIIKNNFFINSEDTYKNGFFVYFERRFLYLKKNQEIYLNSYHKYILNSVDNVIEGLSIFLIWLSKYLKDNYVSFFLEFLLIFLLYCVNENKTNLPLKDFLIKNLLVLKDHDNIAKETEKLYFKYLGYSKPLYISNLETIQFFIDYLIGNDMLSN